MNNHRRCRKRWKIDEFYIKEQQSKDKNRKKESRIEKCSNKWEPKNNLKKGCFFIK